MELRQLEILVAIADHGSVSRAAVSLNLSQPSLSRQVARLEDEVGQRLWVRNGRGVEPTAAGERLLEHARAVLESTRRAIDELRDMNESPAGRVTVGMPPRVALGMSVPLVQGFRQRFPRAVITVLEGLSLSLRESLVAGRLDLALLFDPLPSPQLACEPLMREPLLLVAPPGSRLPARASLASLAEFPMVLPSAPNAIRGLLDKVLLPRGVALDVIAEVVAVQTVIALVADGVGCTVLPASALSAGAAAGKMPRAPIGPPTVWNSLVLATPRARPGTRLTRETARLIRTLDFRKGPAAGA